MLGSVPYTSCTGPSVRAVSVSAAPFVQLKSSPPDYLGLVLVTPDLTLGAHNEVRVSCGAVPCRS